MANPELDNYVVSPEQQRINELELMLLTLAEACSDHVLGGEHGWESMDFKEFVALCRKQCAKANRLQAQIKDRPKIVCLCGSTRFHKEFVEQNYNETMKGNIVLTVGFFAHSGDAHGGHIGITSEQKIKLDELHKRKIDLADEVLVINVGGYIGDSTRSEIEYAELHHKQVRYLNPARDKELYWFYDPYGQTVGYVGDHIEVLDSIIGRVFYSNQGMIVEDAKKIDNLRTEGYIEKLTEFLQKLPKLSDYEYDMDDPDPL